MELSVQRVEGRLQNNPKLIIGRDVYRWFDGYGVAHGVITDTTTDSSTMKQIWGVRYDDKTKEDFDVDELLKYALRYDDRKHPLFRCEIGHFAFRIFRSAKLDISHFAHFAGATPGNKWVIVRVASGLLRSLK